MITMDILLRIFSGYLFAAPCLLIYFHFLKRTGNCPNRVHILLAMTFCLYLIFVFTVTGIHSLKEFDPQFEWYFPDLWQAPVGAFLNVLLFIPAGFFLPALYGEFRSGLKTVLFGTGLSLLIETLQMFSMGYSSTNDLITNTLGPLIGFLVFRSVRHALPSSFRKKARIGAAQSRNELLFIVIVCVLVMISIQPWFIHTCFHLG